VAPLSIKNHLQLSVRTNQRLNCHRTSLTGFPYPVRDIISKKRLPYNSSGFNNSNFFQHRIEMVSFFSVVKTMFQKYFVTILYTIIWLPSPDRDLEPCQGDATNEQRTKPFTHARRSRPRIIQIKVDQIEKWLKI